MPVVSVSNKDNQRLRLQYMCLSQANKYITNVHIFQVKINTMCIMFLVAFHEYAVTKTLENTMQKSIVPMFNPEGIP